MNDVDISLPGEEEYKQLSKRMDVCVGLSLHAVKLLARRITQRSGLPKRAHCDETRQILRNAKIGKFPRASKSKNIGWLEIAMHDVLSMKCSNATNNL